MFRNLRRHKSYNQGLDEVRTHVMSNEDSEGNMISPEDVKEMQTLLKLVSYNAKDFHFRWALVILLLNIYNIFTVPFFLGMRGFPSGLWLGVELICEVFLLLDALGRLIFRSTIHWKRMWMLHDCRPLFVALSSLPYSLLTLLIISERNEWWVAMIRLPKLLRFSQFSYFFTHQRIVTRSVGLSALEIVKLLLILVGIMHLAGCMWMCIARFESNFGYDYYWMRPWKDGNATQLEIYVDACFWAASTLTSIGFGDLTPSTNLERLFAVIVMVIGASTYASIFGTFVVMLMEKNYSEVEAQQKLERAKRWCSVRNLLPDIKERVFTYYSLVRSKFSDLMEIEFIEDLPLSLKTEISLFLHRELIPKVKLFELGDPAFLMGIVRYLRPKLFMAGDFIVKQGDFSEELFFLRVGTVEILATDNVSVIALLEEGAVFGEIGLFLAGTRSVSVRARTATLVSCISKENLFRILKNFPEYQTYLSNIGEQRLRTTNAEDIDMSVKIEDSGFEEEQNSEDNWLRRMTTITDKTMTKKYEFIIDTLSLFYYLWGALVVTSYCYYMFYIPLGIAFEVEPEGWLLYCDLVCYTIFILDIFVNLNTSILTDFKNVNRNKEDIVRNYLNQYMILDICSVLPVDVVLSIVGISFARYLRVTRLCKTRRVLSIVQTIQSQVKYSMSLFKLFQYFVYFIFFSHISACLFYLLIRIQDAYTTDLRFDDRNFITAFSEQPYQHYDAFFDLSISEQYAHMVYWSYSITATGAYGDIIAVTVPEKVFNVIIMILSKFFIAFIYAEAATVVSNSNRSYTEHAGKLGLVKEWMIHIKLPHDLFERVTSYYELLWTKLKGQDDEEILTELPEGLRNDIKAYLFEGLGSSGIFPKDQPGPIMSILKKCHLAMICKGENIVYEGEIGLEMYFIVEGEAEVISSSGVSLNTLKAGMVFGEMALLKSVPTVRGATVKARTNVTLAVLSIDDFAFVMELYPDFAANVRTQAAQRERMNRATLHRASVRVMTKPKETEQDSTVLETSGMVAVTKPKIPLIERLNNSKVPNVLCIMVWIWNIIFVPYQLAFEIDYSGWILVLEIISIIFYLFFSFFYLYSSKVSYSKSEEYLVSVLKGIYYLLISIPFALLIEDLNIYADMFLSMIRVSNFFLLIQFFKYMKQKMTWFNLTRIIEVMVIYFIVSHINACFFIKIGLNESESWINRIPSPQPTGERTVNSEELTNSVIYIHALYWSIVSLSHIGTGDITPISVTERVYTCLFFLLGCFIYAILFVNITSLVSSFASHLRSKLQDSYNYVADFLEKKNLQDTFSEPVNDYFKYLWYQNKGIHEQILLKHLPPSLMSDIQMFRYSRAIHKSDVFRNLDGGINIPLTKSLFKVLETKYYLTNDTIIHAGDKNYDFYILLDGEVQVIDFEGNRILDTIYAGGHFGEANLLFEWTKIRTASIVATKICQIGVISRERFEALLQAFPEFNELLLSIALDRMRETFLEQDVEAIEQHLEDLRENMVLNPESVRLQQQKTHRLVALTVAEILRDPPPTKRLATSILHLILLIYSGFVIPFMLGFGIKDNIGLLVVEVLIFVESLGFFAVNCRYSIILKARSEMEIRDIISYYYHHYLFEDMLAASPFNPLFLLLDIDTPGTYLLRLMRMFALLRLPSLLEKIELYSRKVTYITRPFRAVLLLVFLTHWCSCMWYFVVRTDGDWLSYFSLESLELSEKYLYAVYYTMNTVTSLGYGDLFPTSTSEIFVTILIILMGDALFAVAFGLMATAASASKAEFHDFIENLKGPYKILDKVPKSVIKRIETYYAFRSALNQRFGPTDFSPLFSHLPSSIVAAIIYECNKDLLKKLPLIANACSEELLEQLAVSLTPKVFFPDDIVIYKNDVGEEMYFIIEGTVSVISTDGLCVVASLSKGDYIGEVALVTNSRRTCSVIANSLCLMYSLHKESFQKILKRFPEIYEEIHSEAEKRYHELNEYSPEINENNLTTESMNMYAAISSPFYAKDYNKKLNAFTGLQNFSSEIAIGAGINDSQPQKRRPHVQIGHERRLSQLSLGKEMILSRFSKLKMQWTMNEG